MNLFLSSKSYTNTKNTMIDPLYKYQSWYCEQVKPIYHIQHNDYEFDIDVSERILSIIDDDVKDNKHTLKDVEQQTKNEFKTYNNPFIMERLHSSWFSNMIKSNDDDDILFVANDIETGFDCEFTIDEENSSIISGIIRMITE